VVTPGRTSSLPGATGRRIPAAAADFMSGRRVSFRRTVDQRRPVLASVPDPALEKKGVPSCMIQLTWSRWRCVRRTVLTS
jgi:hypothetical protein